MTELSRREDVQADIRELMVLGEIASFIGKSGAEDGRDELPASWFRWIGGQIERLAHLANSDLG